MDPVGQASSARNACRRTVPEPGWALTKDVSAASPKTAGAICLQASQSMQVESTKKSPGTFSGTRFRGFAMPSLPSLHCTGMDSTPLGGLQGVGRVGFVPLHVARRPVDRGDVLAGEP